MLINLYFDKPNRTCSKHELFDVFPLLNQKDIFKELLIKEYP